MRTLQTTLLGAVAASLFLGAAVRADDGNEIKPHRVLFLVELAEPSSVLEQARGLAALEVARECDGWRYKQRFELETRPVSGEPAKTAFNIDGKESLDGRDYTFRSTTDYGVGDPLLLVGRAEKTDAGGSVRYTEPFAVERPLPEGVGFAIGSVRAALKAAREGDGALKQPWFVGSSPDEPLLVNSVILPESPKEDAPALLRGQRWRFVSAFFADGEDGQPIYEGDEILLANGVLAGAVYRYDGYALRMTLQRVEPLPLPDC